MNDSIIVYRSAIEQQADQFWLGHPEFVVYGIYVLLIFAAIYCLFVLGQYLFNRFCGRRRRGGRWA